MILVEDLIKFYNLSTDTGYFLYITFEPVPMVCFESQFIKISPFFIQLMGDIGYEGRDKMEGYLVIFDGGVGL